MSFRSLRRRARKLRDMPARDVLFLLIVIVSVLASLGLLAGVLLRAPLGPVPQQHAPADAQTAGAPTPILSAANASYIPITPQGDLLDYRRQIDSGAPFITLFGGGGAYGMWHVANHDGANGFWRNDFRRENVTGTAEGLAFSITRKTRLTMRPWDAGEISTRQTYGYGHYEVVMKPARGSGLVSSFFTYNGPHFGKPHDEIDIEFLGKDTRRVQFGLYKDGKAKATRTIDLPYDAADEFHLYGFEWHPDRVTWFIDNQIVHQTENARAELPVTPGKIMMNLWTGTIEDWHGPADFMSGATARYACVSFRPIGSSDRACSDFYLPAPLPGTR